MKKLLALVTAVLLMSGTAAPAMAARGFHGGGHFHAGRGFHGRFHHGFRGGFFPGFTFGVLSGAALTAPWWYGPGYYAPVYPYPYGYYPPSYPTSTCYTYGGQWVWNGAQWVWQPC